MVQITTVLLTLLKRESTLIEALTFIYFLSVTLLSLLS